MKKFINISNKESTRKVQEIKESTRKVQGKYKK